MSASEDKEMNNPKWAIDAQGALACSQAMAFLRMFYHLRTISYGPYALGLLSAAVNAWIRYRAFARL
jgi:hypothetical protein